LKQKRVGIYARVSTTDQSCELQLREMLAFVTARGWDLAGVYEDTGASGTTTRRPQFQKLLHDARARRLDVIVVWKLDRWARSLSATVTILAELQELGCEFVSLRDNLDLSTSAGRLFGHLIAAFAEYEASIIRERVRAGLANARAKGKRLGRPTIHDPSAIRELRQKGLSYRAIAKKLRVPMGTITSALRSCAQKT
jgi:putative DNA-invertase from lambdoid prophage Rac